MATYNGEDYLDEQIQSILNQDDSNWILYISDDSSIDNTRNIIRKYCKQKSDQIFLIDGPARHSATINFIELLKFVANTTTCSYFMFCDQDDVWIKNKISLSRLAMEKVTRKENLPVLVHSDLIVVDKNLKVLNESLMSMRSLNPYKKDLAHLLIQNNVTGCTMFFNRSLLELSLKVTKLSNIAMHDWWIALVAAAFGNIEYINTPTILYRQHANNVVGAKKVRSFHFVSTRLFMRRHIKATFNSAFEQARLLSNCYCSLLPTTSKTILIEFLKIPQKKKIKRIYLTIKHRFLKQGIIQILGELIFI